MKGRKYILDKFQKATPTEIKNIQLELLENVLNFCEKENIKVFLAFGSLIGAIRHKGYIPWDDDIDLWMLREDYEHFISKYNIENSGYRVSSIINDSMYPFPFAKVSKQNTYQFEQIEGQDYNVGINIDVFPVNNLPTDGRKQQRLLKRWERLRAICTLKGINHNKKRKWYKNLTVHILNFIFKPIKIETLSKKMNEIAQFNTSSVSEQVFTHEGWIVLDRSWFSETIDMPFEHLSAPVPIGYNQILTTIYGDYMQLPPENQRVAHHAYESFVPREQNTQYEEKVQ